MKKQKSGIADVHSHLTLRDAGLCDVFKDHMAKEVEQKLKADEQQYTQTQHDLDGNLYLVPNKYTRWPIQLSTPSRTDVLMYEALKIRRENGRLDTVVFRLIITKVRDEWKVEAYKPPEDLCGNIYPMLRRIRMCVKRAKDGTTEPVHMIKTGRLASVGF